MNLATPVIKILTRFKQNNTDYDVSHISDKEGTSENQWKIVGQYCPTLQQTP